MGYNTVLMRKEDKQRILGDLGFKPGMPQDRGIETLREKWAIEKRAIYPEQKAELAVVSREKAYFLDYPFLGMQDYIEAPSWVPRVNPITGAVYTTRWQKIAINETNAGNFIALGGIRYNPDLNLSELPKSWRTIMLVPQEIEGGLEPAMRQQDEIRHDYMAQGSIEQGRVETALMSVYYLSDAFARGEIKNERDLKRLSIKTEKILEKEGLINATDQVWKTFTDYTLRATQKDSLGRRNPTRSRILARAAYLKAVEKEIDARLVREKANRVFVYLDVTRTMTRINLLNAMDSLDRIAGVDKERGMNIFSEIPDDIAPRETVRVSEVLRGIVDSYLKPIQAAPYLGVARAAEAMLLGTYFKFGRGEIDQMESTLEEAGFTFKIANRAAEEYLREKNIVGAQAKIRQVHSLIKASLEDPNHKETTVFE